MIPRRCRMHAVVRKCIVLHGRAFFDPIIQPAFIFATWDRASPEARVRFKGYVGDWLRDTPPPFSRLVFFVIDRWRWHRSSSSRSSGWWRAEWPQSVALRPSQTLCVCRGAEGDACGRVMHVWGCQGMGGFWLVSLSGAVFLLSLKTGWKHEPELICFSENVHCSSHKCDGMQCVTAEFNALLLVVVVMHFAMVDVSHPLLTSSCRCCWKLCRRTLHASKEMVYMVLTFKERAPGINPVISSFTFALLRAEPIDKHLLEC